MTRSMSPFLLLLITAIISFVLDTVQASAGDRSLVYTRCLSDCKYINCLGVSDEDYAKAQPFYLRVLQWKCPNECQYDCMWQAVEAYQKDGSKIPQFHGKWPFIRFFGIQEPASVIASILNFISVAIGLLGLWTTVSSCTPMFYVWNFHGLVCLQAWFWSAVFHTRDLPFTERLDYFTALSLVMSTLMCFCLRLAKTRPLWKCFVIPVPFILYYIYHCYYLTYVRFDYSYNMIINLAVGIVSSTCWTAWCLRHWKDHPHVKKCFAAMIITNVAVLLEVFDFLPILWVFDAHSLWHFGTVPVGFLFFSFAAEDCLHTAEALSMSEKNKIL